VADLESGKKPTMYNRWTAGVAMTIGSLFPRTAIKYVRARNALTSYAAATRQGPNKAWLPSNMSADEIIKSEQPLLRARARSLVRDSSQVGGALRKITNNVVFKGINPQARLKRGDKPDKNINNEVEAAFKKWAAAVDFYEKERLIIRHLWHDGELFAHYYFDQELYDAGIIPLGIELMECDHLDTTKSGVKNDVIPGKEGTWKQGILYSKYKRPLGYQLFLDHPGTSTWWTSNFARENVLWSGAQTGSPSATFFGSVFFDAYMTDHLFIRDRISQNRGLPWLTSVIMEMRDFNEYQAAERIAARLAAAFGIFVETDFPEHIGSGISPIGGDANSLTIDDIPDYMEPGRIQPLPPGMKVEAPSMNRPGQSYEPFTKTSLRGASTGFNMSYEAFSNDYTGASYSSARSATLEERRGYQVQQIILLNLFHIRAWERLWRMNQISRTVKNAPEVIPVKWQVPGWPWIDPLKDSKAAETDIKNGMTSRHKILDSRGEDYEEIKADLDAEKEDGFVFQDTTAINTGKKENATVES
jgi:lambda family phage portal protein